MSTRSVGLPMLDWLQTPLDPSRAHDITLTAAWHARLMVLAWLVLFPAGILAARYFKITPRQRWPTELDNKAWWYTHQSTQYAGGVLALVALGLIVSANGLWASGLHGKLGWLAMTLLAVQVVGGWLRGSKGGPTAPAPDGSLFGDHYDMTRRRRLFERVHKSCGYLALLVACAAVASGLWHANAPRWMALGILVWTLGVAAVAIGLQRRGMAVDTYQAIWGPDPQHPGNRLAPIGWGVRRPGPPSEPDR